MFSRGCGYPQGCCKMEIVTLGIYSQKVTIFVLCIVADNQALATQISYVVKLPETQFRLKGFASLFSKSDKDFKSGQIITTS